MNLLSMLCFQMSLAIVRFMCIMLKLPHWVLEPLHIYLR